MKTIKIYGLPSHQTEDRTSGVDFARIIQPLTALDGYSTKKVKFETTVYDITKEANWKAVAQEFDIIYLNYIVNPWGYAAMGAMARGHGKKIVMDLDDALWYVRPDNPTAKAYEKGGENIRNLTAMLNDVDAVTVTNDYLRNVVIAQTDKKYNQIHVFNNYIDLENMYMKKPPFKNTPRIKIAHHGSTTHFEDLISEEFAAGVDRIMREYPNVTIEFIGAFIPKYKERWGMRYIDSFGDRDIYKWANERFPQLAEDIDIMVTPLQNNVYTRCKSGIKFLENGAMGKPGVYQNMDQYRQYINHGENGFLADTADDWYQSLKKLVDDAALRKSVGEKARLTVKDNLIQDHLADYAAFFTELVAK